MLLVVIPVCSIAKPHFLVSVRRKSIILADALLLSQLKVLKAIFVPYTDL